MHPIKPATKLASPPLKFQSLKAGLVNRGIPDCLAGGQGPFLEDAEVTGVGLEVVGINLIHDDHFEIGGGVHEMRDTVRRGTQDEGNRLGVEILIFLCSNFLFLREGISRAGFFRPFGKTTPSPLP